MLEAAVWRGKSGLEFSLQTTSIIRATCSSLPRQGAAFFLGPPAFWQLFPQESEEQDTSQGKLTHLPHWQGQGHLFRGQMQTGVWTARAVLVHDRGIT